MNGPTEPLRSAHCRAYGFGLGLCLATPGVMAGLVVSGAVPAGTLAPEGFCQEIGYLFTGLVFLSSTWVWWRAGRVLRAFKDLPGGQRASLVGREVQTYAVVLSSSCFCGLGYWRLVGHQAARHVWGFILMTPLLFLALVPRWDRWAKALED